MTNATLAVAIAAVTIVFIQSNWVYAAVKSPESQTVAVMEPTPGTRAVGATQTAEPSSPVGDMKQADAGDAKLVEPDAVVPGKIMTVDDVRTAIAAADQKRQESAQPDPALSGSIAAGLADNWGVKVIGIRRTSAGYMLDFRFRVLDAEKALPLFDHRIKPYVLTERTRVKLPVPMAAKVGAFRPTNRGKNIKADKDYYMVFANPDNYVKSGQKVSVVIGEFRAEHLTVQ